jgi:hypothetical protein
VKPQGAVRLHVEPITLRRANEYVDVVHRHHGPRQAGPDLYSIAAITEWGEIRGVATTAQPNAANRLTDGFRTAEVVRVATDGTPNACSILYAASARAAKALGFSRIISYVLDTETGASIKAAGWVQDEGEFGNLSWANRPGRTGNNFGPKGRWSMTFHDLDRPEQHFPDGLIPDPEPDAPTLFRHADGVEETTPANQPGSVGAMPARRSYYEAEEA